jgi:Tfp pilus assembly protein FimT
VGVTRRLWSAAGITLIDIVIAMALIGVLAGIAVPALQNMANAIVHGQAQQMIESELQQARLKAVSTNRIIRVRFNCPVAGQFRIVELIGTPTAPAAQDTAANRCSDTAYPYPAGDHNPVTVPNQDGPVKQLDSKISFGAAPTIEFRPAGSAHSVNADGTSGPPLAGAGTAITVTKGAVVKTVTVNGLGKIEGVQ